MALFSFYNVRKPRQFDHKPIYWDPHKEAMEDRIRKVKREIGMEEELSIDDYKAEIKGSFVEGTSHLKKSRDNGHDSRSRTYKNMFTGDIQQIDQPYLDSQSNGLVYMIDRMKDQNIFAHVNLVKGERSQLSELASNLL